MARLSRVHYVLVRFPKLSETFVLSEMLGLERLGCAVSVDTLEDPLDEPRDGRLATLRATVRRVPDRLPARALLGVHLRLAARRPGAWLTGALRALGERRWPGFLRAGVVARRAQRERADVLHVHFAYYCADVARDAGRLGGLPVTLYAHGNDIWSAYNAPQLSRRLEGARAVATCSAYNAEHLRRVAPGVAVSHLPLGIAVAAPVERDPGAPILFVGRLVEKKGADLAIRALAAARREQPSLRLDLIGDGPLRAELEALVAKLGLDGAASFRGLVEPDEVEAAYSRCSAVVLPCRVAGDGDRDGLPTVLLEAMARGLPVVSTRLIGIPELIRDGETGLLAPPEDPDGLGACLVRLRADSELAARLGRAARDSVAREHELTACVRERAHWLARAAGN
jgi:glycosyltransferase involved in cell wall biosynthesis